MSHTNPAGLSREFLSLLESTPNGRHCDPLSVSNATLHNRFHLKPDPQGLKTHLAPHSTHSSSSPFFSSLLSQDGYQVKVHHLFFFALVLLSAIVAQSDDCVYTAYVRTGSILKGGTDSIINLALYDADGDYLEISNLESWGVLMGGRHGYWERGNLDIFSGRGRCLRAPVCAMELTSDGSEPHPGWYCNYVEVTTTGAHITCKQQLFTVEQWIALDAPPFELSLSGIPALMILRTTGRRNGEETGK